MADLDLGHCRMTDYFIGVYLYNGWFELCVQNLDKKILFTKIKLYFLRTFMFKYVIEFHCWKNVRKHLFSLCPQALGSKLAAR